MEKSLEDFLSMPDVNSLTEEIFVSNRLGKFTVRPMTAEEHGEYLKRCRIKDKKGSVELDPSKFHLMIVVGQTVKPDFKNAELLKKAGCATPAELISKKLLAGEIAEAAEQICVISGFDKDINEDIEEAKN